MWFLSDPSTVTSIDSFQNNTRSLPRFALGTTNMLSNYIFLFTYFSPASPVHVSAINMTEGSLVRTRLASSFTVHGFPSPWQFHTKQLIAMGGAEHQPPPLNLNNFHHPLKPIEACLVTPDGLPHFSSLHSVCLFSDVFIAFAPNARSGGCVGTCYFGHWRRINFRIVFHISCYGAARVCMWIISLIISEHWISFENKSLTWNI